MKRNDPSFQMTLSDATDCLMEGFGFWNDVQAELASNDRENNFHDDKAFAFETGAFRAIAERFVLEDVEWKDWQWLETPWAGTDANTGDKARILYFTNVSTKASEWGIAAFYVAHNRHGWYAIPLAEFQDYMGLHTYEVNSVQAALNAMRAITFH